MERDYTTVVQNEETNGYEKKKKRGKIHNAILNQYLYFASTPKALKKRRKNKTPHSRTTCWFINNYSSSACNPLFCHLRHAFIFSVSLQSLRSNVVSASISCPAVGLVTRKALKSPLRRKHR